MALYEYLCSACGARTEKRMPMSDVLQVVPCGKCGKQARKAFGGWAVVGRADASVGDGPDPWGNDGGDDDGGNMAGMPDDLAGGGHGHSHGPGGHTH